MAREWKPGDVALIRVGSGYELEVGIWSGLKWYVAGPRYGSQHGWYNERVEVIRPLLVIDPENREQVARLVELLGEHGWRPTEAHGLRDALRSLLDPKPDEPTGLGAVVRDRQGVLWVRAEKAKGMQNPWQDTLNSVARDDRIRAASWSDIDVVSADDILSAGVEVGR